MLIGRSLFAGFTIVSCSERKMDRDDQESRHLQTQYDFQWKHVHGRNSAVCAKQRQEKVRGSDYVMDCGGKEWITS